MHILPRLCAIALLGLLAATRVHAEGSVVDYVEPKNATNPPPKVALDAFDRFEIRPFAMDAPYAGQPANESAKQHLQENLDLRVRQLRCPADRRALCFSRVFGQV